MDIDVTKCGFYHPEHGKECHIALAFADDYTDADHTYLLCEQNPNCYYKQLQQLRTENEERKKGVMLKCPQCGEIYLDSVACEVYEKMYEYEHCLDEIENILKEHSSLFTNPPLYMIDKIIKKAKS